MTMSLHSDAYPSFSTSAGRYIWPVFLVDIVGFTSVLRKPLTSLPRAGWIPGEVSGSRTVALHYEIV